MFDDLTEESTRAALPEDARCVLAAALARPELLPALGEVLRAEDFDAELARPLWLALTALQRHGAAVSPENVLGQLARQGNFAAMSILDELEDLRERAPEGAELEAAVGHLRRGAQRREVVALLEELVAIGLARDDDAGRGAGGDPGAGDGGGGGAGAQRGGRSAGRDVLRGATGGGAGGRI